MNVKVGDVVHVRGVVSHVYLDHIRIGSEGQEPWVFRATAIVHVEPRPLKAGGRVQLKCRPGTSPYKLLAIDGERAWIYNAAGDAVVELSSLERVND